MKGLFDIIQNKLVDYPFFGEYTQIDPYVILVDVVTVNPPIVDETQKVETIWVLKNGNEYTQEHTVVPRTQQDIENDITASTPSEVQLWKLRAVLKSQNLFTSVQSAISSIQDVNIKLAAEEGFEYGNTVTRNSLIISLIQQSLNLTDQQVNLIFIQADNLQI